MPERSAVSSEFLAELMEALKRIERGVNLVAWRLGQFEETVGIIDMKFDAIESLDKVMRQVATTVGAVSGERPDRGV